MAWYDKKYLMWLLIIISLVLMISGCGQQLAKPTVEDSARQDNVPSLKTLTAYELITLSNHPRLADSVASVVEFYKPLLGSKVKIVEGNSDGVGSILFFKKEYRDEKIGSYERHNIGEVDKVICYFSKAGVEKTLEEVKPIVLSYFPIGIARKNFVYDKGHRFYDDNGNVIYAWSYKSNGANYYKGRPPYGGNLTVAVMEQKGKVTAFGMFYGQNQRLPFMTSAEGYSVEPYETRFE